MLPSQDDLHRRYRQQATWTARLRDYVFVQARIQPQSLVLEVGSGSGAVLGAYPTPNGMQGLDIDLRALRYAKAKYPGLDLAAGDARKALIARRYTTRHFAGRAPIGPDEDPAHAAFDAILRYAPVDA